MFIINRYTISTPAPVVATNDANAVTGNQSALWGGINPSAVGATGNAGAGNGLTNVTGVNVFADQAIGKVVQLTIAGALTAGQDNYVRVPLNQLGITLNKGVFGILLIGVYDSNATENNNTPTPSLINVPSGAAFVSVVKDAIDVKIVNGNQALFQNKTLNIMLFHQ